MKQKYLVSFITLFLLGIFCCPEAYAEFSLTPPRTDLSLQYLSMIFGVVPGVLHSTGPQILSHMFGMFNSAVLALGGIIITYTLFVSTLNTAAEGEIMGRKWSSIWIPLRTAAGMALLIPKATGYSAIQVFVMWVAVSGIGAADSIWNTTVNYVHSGGGIIRQPQVDQYGGNNANIPASWLLTTTSQMFTQEVCLAYLQRLIQTNYDQKVAGFENPPPDLINISINQLNETNGIFYLPPCLGYQYGIMDTCTPSPDPKLPYQFMGYCGSVSITPPYTFSPPMTQNPALLAVKQMYLDMQGPATMVAQAVVDHTKSDVSAYSQPLGLCSLPNHICADSGISSWWGYYDAKGVFHPGQGILSPYLIHDTATDALGIMSAALQAQGPSPTPLSDTVAAYSKQDGWIMAGKYYWDLAQANNTSGTFKAYSGDLTKYFSVSAPTFQSQNQYFPAAQYFQFITNAGGDNAWNDYLNSAVALQTNYGNLSQEDLAGQTFIANMNKIMAAVTVLIGTLAIPAPFVAAMLIPFIAGMFTVIAGMGNLLISQQANINPIVSLAIMGGGMLNFVTGYFIAGTIGTFLISFAMSLVPLVSLGTAVSAATSFITPFLTACMVSIFSAGFILAYYIPLIPFILFTFGGLGWLISLIEAMVAAPLVALGIAYPEDHEILGRSKDAVLLLANVFLRPSLMLFGYIGGIILSYIGIWIFNRGFFYALNGIYTAATSTGSGGGIGTFMVFVFAPIAIIVLYTGICLVVINKAFSLIHIVPDRVFRWIGGNLEGHMEAQALQEVKQTAQSAAGTVGQAVGKQGEASWKTAGELGAKAGAAANPAPTGQGPGATPTTTGGGGGGGGTGGGGAGGGGTGGGGTGGGGTGGGGAGGGGGG